MSYDFFEKTLPVVLQKYINAVRAATRAAVVMEMLLARMSEAELADFYAKCREAPCDEMRRGWMDKMVEEERIGLIDRINKNEI